MCADFYACVPSYYYIYACVPSYYSVYMRVCPHANRARALISRVLTPYTEPDCNVRMYTYTIEQYAYIFVYYRVV
jgi:CRISPR/Cas system-associated protein endoribonuclease Cas2